VSDVQQCSEKILRHVLFNEGLNKSITSTALQINNIAFGKFNQYFSNIIMRSGNTTIPFTVIVPIVASRVDHIEGYGVQSTSTITFNPFGIINWDKNNENEPIYFGFDEDNIYPSMCPGCAETGS
jgi:hypothetical protein